MLASHGAVNVDHLSSIPARRARGVLSDRIPHPVGAGGMYGRTMQLRSLDLDVAWVGGSSPAKTQTEEHK